MLLLFAQNRGRERSTAKDNTKIYHQTTQTNKLIVSNVELRYGWRTSNTNRHHHVEILMKRTLRFSMHRDRTTQLRIFKHKWHGLHSVHTIRINRNRGRIDVRRKQVRQQCFRTGDHRKSRYQTQCITDMRRGLRFKHTDCNDNGLLITNDQTVPQLVTTLARINRNIVTKIHRKVGGTFNDKRLEIRRVRSRYTN